MTGLGGTGLNGQRVYLDWNATAPLRPEARIAMLEAMDVVGNPSSVHSEGRAAKAIVEKARSQVAALAGCEPTEVVFTSGATEAAAAVLSSGPTHCAETEHDCIEVHRKGGLIFPTDRGGLLRSLDPTDPDTGSLATELVGDAFAGIVACGSASGETGVEQDLRNIGAILNSYCSFKSFADVVQTLGKRKLALRDLDFSFACGSGHKIGGPKGIGLLYVRSGYDVPSPQTGGGQEQGRRSGTENVIGIAGFGAAAEAARHNLEDGTWERVEKLRNALENRLAEAACDTIFFGNESPRLPNTSCFAVPAWKGETQVMQMDLAGFAVSAGSACSSGKVNKASRVLRAMGFDEMTASSAIRVSMGPTTTEAEVMAFADAWTDAYRRREARAA